MHVSVWRVIKDHKKDKKNFTQKSYENFSLGNGGLKEREE